MPEFTAVTAASNEAKVKAVTLCRFLAAGFNCEIFPNIFCKNFRVRPYVCVEVNWGTEPAEKLAASEVRLIGGRWVERGIPVPPLA
jgi:hypothetical protein